MSPRVPAPGGFHVAAKKRRSRRRDSDVQERERFERRYGAGACPFCFKDWRGPDHQRGCPDEEPLTKAELLELAGQVEAGWAARAKAVGA